MERIAEAIESLFRTKKEPTIININGDKNVVNIPDDNNIVHIYGKCKVCKYGGTDGKRIDTNEVRLDYEHVSSEVFLDAFWTQSEYRRR